MESSEVAESSRADSSGEVRTLKRRRDLAVDAELLESSPSSCVLPESKKRSLFNDPATPTNARRGVVLVLLPNNTKLLLSPPASRTVSIDVFINFIRATAGKEVVEPGPKKRKRQVRWGNVFLEDSLGNAIANVATLKNVLQQPTAIILVQDGESDTKHMHELDITPEPKMLGRLPQGYNVETALADEVDNALQAVWHVRGRRRLISVDVKSEKISIFDTGSGMDVNSIKYWGKPGGSSHRDVHMLAIGGIPPFLTPYLGKYGAGGVAAALHLGSFVTVSSKTTESKKVVTLDLSKDDLDKRWQSNKDHWLTPGQFREMTTDEKRRAPGGSFTCVEISKLKRQYINLDREILKTRILLADIYYDYIQSEDFGVANRDLDYPIEFEVNGVNLAEVRKCETATLLQHRCNGAPFVIDLAFSGPIADPDDEERIRSRNKAVAHARVTCHYFPSVKGKEELDAAIEELTLLKICKKSFDDFPRVTVRWLGRLLPEDQWDGLPFMKAAGKKETVEGWKLHWSKRVRATIELDAGFHPTQSKTQLERDHPFTVALQKLGDLNEMKKSCPADGEVVIKRAGKIITPKVLVDDYVTWLRQMHDDYDEEVMLLDNNPTFICDQPSIYELLGLTKDKKHEYAVVFYKHMRDKQGDWKVSKLVPLHVKIPKAASRQSSDLYATVEWFCCQGTDKDEHGEVKMVVRPINVPESEGSEMKMVKDERLEFKLNRSKVLAWTLPKNSKLQRLSPQEWSKKQEEFANKAPSFIEVLDDADSKALNCDQTLPTKLSAGSGLPEFLVVVRPKKGSGASFKQQSICSMSFEMKLQVTLNEGSSSQLKEKGTIIWTGSVGGSERNNVKQCYVFDTKDLKFVKQGTYNLKFELSGERASLCSQVKPLERTVIVEPSAESKGWKMCLDPSQGPPLIIRCGLVRRIYIGTAMTSTIQYFKLDNPLIADFLFVKPDIYDNLQYIKRIPRFQVSLETSDGIEVLSRRTCKSENFVLSSDRKNLNLKKAVLFSEGNIGPFGPTREGCLVFHIEDEVRSLAEKSTLKMKCLVYPGKVASVSVLRGPLLQSGNPMSIVHPLRPHDVIDTLCLQGKDLSGNAVIKGQRVEVRLDNLNFRDKLGPFREFAEGGILDFGELLMVTGPYGSRGSVSVFCESQTGERRKLIEILFKVASCRLQIAHPVRRSFPGGSTLEGVIVEVLSEDGTLDTTMDGPFHSLMLGWMKNVTCPVIKGRCELPSFPLPSMHGPWCGQIRHTSYENLGVDLQLNLEIGIASRLVLPANYQATSATNDEVFLLRFLALDGHGQPAILTNDMTENMVVEVDPGHCSVTGFKITATSDCRTSFAAQVQLGGAAGKYTVVLKSSPNAYPALDLEEQPGSTALVAWGVNLKPGKLARLGYQVIQNESWVDSVNFIEVSRHAIFPAIKAQLLDGYNNICLLHEQQMLDLVLKKQGAGGVSACQSCQINNGQGMFQPFDMEAAEGIYQMTISVSRFTFLPGSAVVKEPALKVTVTRANNLATLRLTNDSLLRVKLLEDLKPLRDLTVTVDPVNNQPLRCFNPPHLQLMTLKNSEITCIQEIVGEEVSCLGQADSSKTFRFPPFSVPTIAGKYLLNFLLPDYEVTPCSRPLEVLRGDPTRLELSVTQIKNEGWVAQARVVDMYGNFCDQVTGLKLNLTLRVSAESLLEASSSSGVQRSCYLRSKEQATVKSGVANFEKIELSQGGRPGPYILRVFVEPDQKLALGQLGFLKPSEVEMFVTSDAQQLQLQESVQSCQENVKARREELIELKSRIQSAREESRLEQVTLEKLLSLRPCRDGRNNPGTLSVEDEGILRIEQDRPRRGERDIMQDLDRLAQYGNSCAVAALAFLQAREGENFLSPNGPLASEAIGLVVTLARVENENFNKILCEYLSSRTLMLPICKTQAGVNALERRRGGIVDASYGLASVSRYPLTSNYDVLALSDVSVWNGYEDRSHPQLLLRIPPPRLAGTSNEVPRGFLGYAVNLLHIKPEYLNIRVNVTSMPIRSFNLRESLFYHQLKRVQVYDTRDNMNLAKQLNALSGGGMSLDGYLIRPNMRQQLGVRDPGNSSISFALVPYEERLETCGVFPPSCEAIRRCQRLQQVQQLVEMQDRQIQEVRASVNEKRRKAENLLKEVSDAEKALKEAEAKEKEVKKQQEGLWSSLKRNNQLHYKVQ